MSPLVKHLSFVTRSASAFFISCFLIMDFYRVVCRMFFISISLIFLASTPVKITSEFQMFNSVVNFFFNYYYFKFTILYWFCHIKMNPPWVYTCSPSWPPPTSHPIPSLWVIPVQQQLQASCILHSTWTGDLFWIWYNTCFNAILPNHSPLPLPQSPKDCSIHLCLFCCLAYSVVITIFLNSIYMH